MAKGQTFLNVPDDTSRGSIRHLHVIITNPDSEKDVLVVPVSRYHEKDGNPFPGQDESCILTAGCHPFVKVKSYISYRHSKAMNLIEIFNGLQKGKLIRKEEFEPRFIQDMQRGADESPFLPEKLKRFFGHFL